MVIPSEQFERLRGIGPAKAARLHRCGIRSWASLAEVLDVLSGISHDPDGALRGLRDEARRYETDEAANAIGDNGPAEDPSSLIGDRAGSSDDAIGERVHPFVVRIHLTPTGSPSRCTVTDVRTETATAFLGLPLADVGAFIRRQLSRPEVVEAGASGPATRDGEAGPSGSAVQELDAGRVLGGRDRTVVVLWATGAAGPGRSRRINFRGVLDARPYGSGDVQGWQHLQVAGGTTEAGEPATLLFDRITLAPGLHRLRVTIESQPGEA